MYIFRGLELQLCHVIPSCNILESLGIRGKYPDILPAEYIDIGEILTYEESSFFFASDVVFSGNLVDIETFLSSSCTTDITDYFSIL